MIDIDSLYPVIANDLASQANNIEYLVHIEGVAYIATRKQMFETDGQETYYEDLDLKVSNIKEKIDIKNKKIYLSNSSITMNNFPVLTSEISVDNERISDRIFQGYGKTISVYFKTQSCKNLDDCLKIADLSITKITHDGDKIKIDAEDKNQQSFYVNLPRQQHVLEKDLNTFSSYDQKVVPILYGHLLDAPAVIYVNEMQLPASNIYDDNNITLLPDNSFISQNNSNIQGIKDYGQPIFTSGDSINEVSFLENDNVVKMKIDDIMCSVNRLPYYNIRDFKDLSIAAFHNYPQFEVMADHIQFNTRYEGESTILKKGGVWTHTFSPSISRDGIFLRSILDLGVDLNPIDFTLINGEKQIKYQAFLPQIIGSNFEFKDSLFTDQQDITIDGTEVEIQSVTSLCVEKLEFESAPNMNVLIKPNGNDYPKDMNFTGNMQLSLIPDNINDSQKLDIFCVPSGYRLDETNFGDSDVINTAELNGFPSELGRELENYLGYLISAESEISPFPEFSITVFGGLCSYINFIFSLHSPFYTSMSLGNGNNISNRFISYLYPQYGLNTDGINSFVIDHENIFKNYERSIDEVFNGLDLDVIENAGLTINAKFPIEKASELTFYYMFDAEPNEDILSTGTDNTLITNLSNIHMRRFWCEAEAFTKEYFLDARGRTDLAVYETRLTEGEPDFLLIDRVTGLVRIVTDSLDDDIFDANSGNKSYSYDVDNKHYLEFIEKLTNPDFKTKMIDGKVYEIMMMCGEAFLYDIEINDITPFKNGMDIPELPWDQFDDGNVSKNNGWDINFKGNRFGFNGDRDINVSEINDELFGRFDGIKLVYGRKVFNYDLDEVGAKEITSIEVAPDEDSIELQEFNTLNRYDGGEISSPLDVEGLSAAIWNSAYHNQLDHYGNMLENPVEISKNLIKTEMNESVTFDANKLKIGQEFNDSIKQAFSVNERLNSREILENIFKHSRSYFNYRSRDGKAIVHTIQDDYSEFDKTIDLDNILKFSYTKTSLKDICGAGCTVKYGYNYGTEELTKTTTKKSMFYADQLEYMSFYGIPEDDFDNYELEFEAPYIQDKASAEYLRNFLFQMNLHQHLIVKLTLDIKDGLELEVGDVVRFNKDPNSVKPYGRTLIAEHEIPKQKILPYFMITSISKGSTSVAIEAYQLHTINMEQLKPTLLGDINEDGIVDVDDANILFEHLLNPSTLNLSEQQFVNADINGDGVLDINDWFQLYELPDYVPDNPPFASIGEGIGYNLQTNEDGELVLDINNINNYTNGDFFNGSLTTTFNGQGNDIDGEITGYIWSIKLGSSGFISIRNIDEETVNRKTLVLQHTTSFNENNTVTIDPNDDNKFIYKTNIIDGFASDGVTISLNVIDDQGLESEESAEVLFFTQEISQAPQIPTITNMQLNPSAANVFIGQVNFVNNYGVVEGVINDSNINTDFIYSTYFPGKIDVQTQTQASSLDCQFYDDFGNQLADSFSFGIQPNGDATIEVSNPRIAEALSDNYFSTNPPPGNWSKIYLEIYAQDNLASRITFNLSVELAFDFRDEHQGFLNE